MPPSLRYSLVSCDFQKAEGRLQEGRPMQPRDMEVRVTCLCDFLGKVLNSSLVFGKIRIR